MFSDGRFVDVRAIRDDSDLRGVVLEYAQAERIEGVARLDPAPAPRPVVKRVRKTTSKA